MRRFVSSTLVAREFHRLAKAETPPRDLTPIQLIKLTYLAHGWAFVYLGSKGLVNEKVEAWQYGPVFPSLYRALKDYGSSPVDEVPKTFKEQRHSDTYLYEDEKALIKSVYNTYKDLDGPQLITLTHQDGTPWKSTWSRRFWNSEIKPDLISSYYHDLYEERICRGST